MEAFLSKIIIDYETAYKAGLRDSYAWHQAVWGAFPGRESEKRDFLTRLDEIDGGFRLLVFSVHRPTKPAWCPADGWECKEITDDFFAHKKFRFSLLANPTKKVPFSPSGERIKNSRRVPLVKREELEGWLTKKAEAGGFFVSAEATEIRGRGQSFFNKAGMNGTHMAFEFVGSLEVFDPELFRGAVRVGFGSAKAFGFGLLCLEPIAGT